METKELIDSLRGYAVAMKALGNEAVADLVTAAADRLEELEKQFDEYFLHC